MLNGGTITRRSEKILLEKSFCRTTIEIKPRKKKAQHREEVWQENSNGEKFSVSRSLSLSSGFILASPLFVPRYIEVLPRPRKKFALHKFCFCFSNARHNDLFLR